ncbi:MAG: hypothetical protein IJR92_00760 [Alphaproteobacteria bacterium]|nr:hypothetical protein [Alphaproteobacteria bacterium]
MAEFIKIPTATGEIDAEVVDIKSCSNVAIECELSDGQTLLIRPVITAVAKVANGENTNYYVRIQNIIEKKQ